MTGLCLVPVDAEEYIRCPGTEVTNHCEHRGCSVANLDPLEEPMLSFTVLLSYPPPQTIFSLLERAEKWAAIHAVDSGALSQSHDDYTLSCPFPESWCLQSLLDRCTLVKKMGKERSLLEASHLILMQFDLSTTELCSQEKLRWKERMLIMLGEHRNI